VATAGVMWFRDHRGDGGGEMAGLRTVCRWLDRALAAGLVGLVVVYQWTLSPLLGRRCRFEPTCSVYFRRAVEQYGAVRGGLKGLARICRCHPWHPGGFDPP
jgi:putative membrane protein insertion efficiency factor